VVAEGVGVGAMVVGVGAMVVGPADTVGAGEAGLGAGLAGGAAATVVCGLATGVFPALGVPEEQAVVSAKAHPAATATRRMALGRAVLITAPCDEWSSHQE
jgi:hypothetical protein